VSNKNVAVYFTSQNAASAEEMRQKLGSRYVVIDHETTLSKFWAIVTWSGQNPTDYFDSYLLPQQDNSLRQVILYYPEYYRSMAVRLFNFNGAAVVPENTVVISYEERNNAAGQVFKVITDVQQYATYEGATANMTGQQRIVGANPLQSPVPLEAIENYQLVHSSDNSTITVGDKAVPSVKIFEFVP
jgi:hypothetical protein